MELRQDPGVWQEGFDAGLQLGTAQSLCPYLAGSNEAWSWHAGFIEGCAARHRGLKNLNAPFFHELREGENRR
jgi:hypothetical protein